MPDREWDAIGASARDLELFLVAGRALAAATTSEELLTAFCRALADRGAMLAWVGLARESGVVDVVAREGEAASYLDNVQVHWEEGHPLAAGPTGTAFRERRIVVVDDVETDPMVAPWRDRQLEFGFRSNAAVPLVAEGRALGVLTVYWPVRDGLSAAGAAVFERIAGDLARGLLAIERRAELLQAQKLEVMGQFANILAHDFRNYLSAIGGFAELALDDLPASSAAHGDLEQIRIAVDQANALIANVLAFARPRAGELASCDVADVLMRTRPLLERLVGDHVLVHVDTQGSLPPAAIGPSLLGQVLLNLATNARDAMPAGGTLRVIAQPEAEADTPAVRLDVVDTGTGITPVVASRLFDPFYTTKVDGAGTGLGLASVRFIIERARGTISVGPTAGGGSTFTIRLPAVA